MTPDGWSIGDELSQHIRRRGYSLERLARESGVSKATIHRWMTGKVVRPYYWENLLSVASALNLSKIETDRLLDGLQLPTLDTLASSATPEQLALMTRWTTRARNNLPGSLTSFIGRQQEVLDVAELLSREDVRLVTLTGPGGAGKTRLSLRIAHELHDVFTDGIFFVPLSSITDVEGLITAIARALDIRDAPGQSPGERLAGYLRQRRMLLVLDNVEQLVHAAPEMVALLEGSQHLTVLVTSRLPLRVSCEHVRPVGLFETPAPDMDLVELRENPAMTLFLHRAGAVDAGFRLTSETAPEVAEICIRLEGRPLAIELAAARCRTFSPAELLQRFPGRLDLGADGPRDLPDRQRSLRSLIDWSFGLLSPEGQELLQRLSVFSGHWSQEGMEAVCGAVSSALPELVEASLVTPLPDGRFSMLETIREYAQERLLASSEADRLRQAHARYFKHLAEAGTPYVPLDPQSGWLTQVDREHENIQAALLWLSTQHDVIPFVEMAGALWPYWHDYSHFREGLRWLEEAIDRGADAPAHMRGSVLTGAFILSNSISEIPRARLYGAQALQIWQDIGDWHGIALAQTYLAHIEYTTGGDAAGFARAQEISQQALDAWRHAGQPLGVAHSLIEISVLCLLTGQFQQALDLISSAREIYEKERNGPGLVRAMMDQGLIRLLQLDLPGAIEDLGLSIHLSREHGAYPLLPWGLFYLGTSYCFAGDLAQASIHLEESLRMHHDNGTIYGMSYALLGFAALRHRQGRHDDAATLCGAVTSLLETTGIVMNPAVREIYERESHSVREVMGEIAFDLAYASGHSMAADEAVALALRGQPVAQP